MWNAQILLLLNNSNPPRGGRDRYAGVPLRDERYQMTARYTRYKTNCAKVCTRETLFDENIKCVHVAEVRVLYNAIGGQLLSIKHQVDCFLCIDLILRSEGVAYLGEYGGLHYISHVESQKSNVSVPA